MAKGRIAAFCPKCKGRTDKVRPLHDSMGLVTLTSWGCYFLLYSLRKPEPGTQYTYSRYPLVW
jgi:hypothetical protein